MQIVLVEPSRAARLAIARLLKAREHKVTGFSDPCAALAKIKCDSTVDAVIIATELTPISGVEVCWEARLLANTRRPIYVLLMSSSLDEKTTVEALDAGADDFISRPPSKEELFARMRAGERLVTLQRELIRQATTDPLTGLLNRRAFFERATQICSGATKNQVAAILLDLDHFKKINDFHGHVVGDEALRAITREAQQDQPIVGRLGGDEVCILLSGCQVPEARQLAEQLRRRIAELRIKVPDGIIKLSCSLGVNELGPGEGVDDLILGADLALYRAKQEGRDCVSTPPPENWLLRSRRPGSGIARRKPRS